MLAPDAFRVEESTTLTVERLDYAIATLERWLVEFRAVRAELCGTAANAVPVAGKSSNGVENAPDS
jgi:hypothetical protein